MQEQVEAVKKVSKKPIPAARKDRVCQVPRVFRRTLDPALNLTRLAAINDLEKKWVNGTVLHFYFLGGDTRQQDIVRESFKQWKELGIGLNFLEVKSKEQAEIRITFDYVDGSSWSYVGRDCLNIPLDEATMNFGWDLRGESDTSLHEIGHAIGFMHEHQNPFAGIVWDEEKVYQYFEGPPNFWPRQITFDNVLAKLNPNEVSGSNWDPDSIMHYAFNAGLIKIPERYFTTGLTPKGGLSLLDIETVRKVFPPITPGLPLLKPFESVNPSLKAGEQVDYRIEPEVAAYHTVQTLGSCDTILALFEDRGSGDYLYITADDDSGTSLNAKIRRKLFPGTHYIIRARLYSTYKSGKFGLVLSYE